MGTTSPYAFSTRFFIDDAAPALVATEGGLTLYGYSRSALTGFNVVYGTKTFTTTDMVARSLGPGRDADFWLDAPIAGGSPMHLWMFLDQGGNSLDFNDVACGASCFFRNDGTASDTAFASAYSPALVFALAPAAAGVPEPSTVALLFSGVGVVSIVSRRTRRRSTSAVLTAHTPG